MTTVWNAQTEKLQSQLQRGEVLETRRDQLLGQLLFCEGCCCGRPDRGFPPLPKDRIKSRWKSGKLNEVIQLTISGCLGPCDLANVACILGADGSSVWLGGLREESSYDDLIQWAEECRTVGRVLPLPNTLEQHRFQRFEAPGAAPPNCDEVCSLALVNATPETTV